MSSGLIDEPPAPEDNALSRRRRSWLLWSLAIVTVIMLAVAATVYAKLTGNIRHIEVTREDLGDARPAKAPTAALNILVVGSDQRDGNTAKYAGERTDTIMLVHLSTKRNNAAVISFPRDSLVQLPACRSREGLPGQQRHLGMINSSFNFGGIGCTWKTIETLTGIHIDHFVKVDFTGFKGMVDSIGGVDLCIPEPIRDKYVQLNLPAGWQTLLGEQALGYVRARYSLGDGSDIGRIQRQQDFVAAMAKKAMSSETLTNPARLLGFLHAATKSVTTDPGLTPRVMSDLALTARSLSSDKVHFVTTPWRYSTAYPGRVEWLEGPAKKLFRLIAADQPLTGSKVRHTQPAAPRRAKTDTKPSAHHAGPATTTTVPYSPEPTPPSSAPCALVPAS
ncbi:LCP family protein [Phyllobacterium zundukense]|uniref:LCP family protein n=1 Tax=Phyllobacterium zundukense TaxID=1867719 RepID=UPI001A9EE385|nr:LCP family protein [Phyllobacterium zundukense]